MMLLRKRKNVVVIALIFLSSLLTLTMFQNCGGKIQSQADLNSLASTSSTDNTSNSTPVPTNPAPLPTGCTTMQPADEETMTSACPSGKVGTGIFSVYSYTCVGSAWVRNSTPTTVNRCTDPTALPLSNTDILKLCRPYVQTGQVAKVTATQTVLNMLSGLGDGGQNPGNGDAISQQSTATIDPKILAGSQNLNTLTIDGQPRQQATYSCKFITKVSCSVLTDGSSTVTRAINMDPQSHNYGLDEVAIANSITDPVKKKAALDKILNMTLALGASGQNPATSCTFDMNSPLTQTSQNFTLTNNKRVSGYRCVQANLKVRVGARTQVDVETSDTYKTLVPTAATDFTTLNVTINNNCWDENKLVPNPAALPATANYGDAVAASDKWLVVDSPNDNQLDSAGNVQQALVGSISIFDKNNLALAPQKLYLNGIQGGGSTGDSTVAATLYSDSLAVSRINRTTGKGYVYFFVFENGAWRQKGPVLQQPTGQDKQRFGHALSLSSTGILAVGAPRFAQNGLNSTAYGDLSGRVYFYSCPTSGCTYLGEIQNSTSPGSVFGTAVSMSGNRVAVGAPYMQAVTDSRGEGYVTVFDIIASPFSYSVVKTINPPGVANPAGYGRGFGLSVSINGNKLIVGSPNRATGSTTITEKIGQADYYSNITVAQTPVTVGGNTAGSLLGMGVALNDKGAFIGCPYCQGGGGSGMGRISYHPFDGFGNITVAPSRYVFPLDRISGDGFGNSVFATNLDVVVGASNRSLITSSGSTVQSAGAAYRYAAP
jgi:hypothetical protein